MKKYLPYILILVTLIGFSVPTYAQTPSPAPANTKYQLLAPLPELCTPGDTKCTVDTTGNLSKYLNPMIKIFIGLCAVLSVVMIVVGGLEYMTSELISNKQAGKERIMQAILGLLIALGAYALLFTINPNLLKSDVNIPDTSTTTAPATPNGTCTITDWSSSLRNPRITIVRDLPEFNCENREIPGTITTQWQINP